MPRIELMSWQSRQRRWIKKHRGKQYTVSCRQLGTEPTREASRALANEWWQTKRAELDRNHFESSGSRIAWNALSETLSNAAEIAKRNRYLPQLASVQTEQAIVSRLTAELLEFPAIREVSEIEQPERRGVFDTLYEAPDNEAPAATLRLESSCRGRYDRSCRR